MAEVTAFLDEETGEWVAVVSGQPFLSWVAPTEREARDGLIALLRSEGLLADESDR
jgi:hypothetical protein